MTQPLGVAETHSNSELARAINSVVANLQLPFARGNVYFVMSSSTAGYADFYDRMQGQYRDSSFAVQPTLVAAVAACVAGRGDVIVLTQGYTTTVSSATALVLNTAGITILGLGTGSDRPVITLDTIVSATIKVTADNIKFENVVISANFADIVSAFTLTTAKNFTLNKVDVVATAVNMNFLHVIDLAATANAADGLTFTNGLWVEPDAATLAFALIDGAVDKLNISDNVMYTGNATQDIPFLLSCGSSVLTGARIQRNKCQMVGNAASSAGLFIVNSSTTSNGLVTANFLKHLTATGDIICNTGTKLAFDDNRMSGVADKSGYTLPAADS